MNKNQIINGGLLTKLKYVYKKLTDVRFKEIYGNYEEYHAKEITGNLHRVNIYKDWIKYKSSVLDMGAGNGFNAEYLKKMLDVDIECYDISQTAVYQIKKRGLPGKVVDLDKLTKIDKVYDYIMLSHCIEHLQDPFNLLKTIKHNFRRGLIISIPNSGFFIYRLQLLLGYFPRQSYTHYHFWTMKDFKMICDMLGYKIIDIEYIKPKQTLLRLIMRLCPSLFAFQIEYYLERKYSKCA